MTFAEEQTMKTMEQDKDVSRRRWEPPAVKAVGTVGEVLRNGGGKVTVLTGDPGEPRKVPSRDK
jgi:hypothetical protein